MYFFHFHGTFSVSELTMKRKDGCLLFISMVVLALASGVLWAAEPSSLPEAKAGLPDPIPYGKAVSAHERAQSSIDQKNDLTNLIAAQTLPKAPAEEKAPAILSGSYEFYYAGQLGEIAYAEDTYAEKQFIKVSWGNLGGEEAMLVLTIKSDENKVLKIEKGSVSQYPENVFESVKENILIYLKTAITQSTRQSDRQNLREIKNLVESLEAPEDSE